MCLSILLGRGRVGSKGVKEGGNKGKVEGVEDWGNCKICPYTQLGRGIGV